MVFVACGCAGLELSQWRGKKGPRGVEMLIVFSCSVCGPMSVGDLFVELRCNVFVCSG